MTCSFIYFEKKAEFFLSSYRVFFSKRKDGTFVCCETVRWSCACLVYKAYMSLNGYYVWFTCRLKSHVILWRLGHYIHIYCMLILFYFFSFGRRCSTLYLVWRIVDEPTRIRNLTIYIYHLAIIIIRIFSKSPKGNTWNFFPQVHTDSRLLFDTGSTKYWSFGTILFTNFPVFFLFNS